MNLPNNELDLSFFSEMFIFRVSTNYCCRYRVNSYIFRSFCEYQLNTLVFTSIDSLERSLLHKLNVKTLKEVEYYYILKIQKNDHKHLYDRIKRRE